MNNVAEMELGEILKEMNNLEQEINSRDPYDCPENFYEDGEVTADEAQAKTDRLTARLAELENELNKR